MIYALNWTAILIFGCNLCSSELINFTSFPKYPFLLLKKINKSNVISRYGLSFCRRIRSEATSIQRWICDFFVSVWMIIHTWFCREEAGWGWSYQGEVSWQDSCMCSSFLLSVLCLCVTYVPCNITLYFLFMHPRWLWKGLIRVMCQKSTRKSQFSFEISRLC